MCFHFGIEALRLWSNTENYYELRDGGALTVGIINGALWCKRRSRPHLVATGKKFDKWVYISVHTVH